MPKTGDETEYSVFEKHYEKDKYPFLFDHEVIDFEKDGLQMRVGNGMALSSSKGLLDSSTGENDPEIMEFVLEHGEKFTKMWYAGVKRIISLHTGNEECCDDREKFTIKILLGEGEAIKKKRWEIEKNEKLIDIPAKEKQKCFGKIRKFAELLLTKIKREHLSEVETFQVYAKYDKLVGLMKSWTKEEEAIKGQPPSDRENKLYQAFFFSDIWYAQFAGGFKLGNGEKNIYRKLFHSGRRTGNELVHTSSLKPTRPHNRNDKPESPGMSGKKVVKAPESSKNPEAENATNLAFEIVKKAIPENGILFLCEAPIFDKGNSIFYVDTVGESTEAFCAIWKNEEVEVVGELIENENFPDVALFQVYKKTSQGEDKTNQLLYKVVVCHFDSSNLMKKEEFQEFRSYVSEKYTPAFIVGDSNITIKKILKKTDECEDVDAPPDEIRDENSGFSQPQAECIGKFIGITKEQLNESKKIVPEPDIRKYWYLDIGNEEDLKKITLSTKKIKKVRIENNGFLNNQVSKGGEEIDVDGMFVLKMNPEQSSSRSSSIAAIAAAAAASSSAADIIKTKLKNIKNMNEFKNIMGEIWKNRNKDIPSEEVDGKSRVYITLIEAIKNIDTEDEDEDKQIELLLNNTVFKDVIQKFLVWQNGEEDEIKIIGELTRLITEFSKTFTKEKPLRGGAIMKSKKRRKSNKRKTKKSSKKRGKSKKSRKKSRKRR